MELTLDIVKAKVFELQKLETAFGYSTSRIKRFEILASDEVLFTTSYFTRYNLTQKISDDTLALHKASTVKLSENATTGIALKNFHEYGISFYCYDRIERTNPEWKNRRMWNCNITTTWFELGKHKDLLKRLYDWACSNLVEKFEIAKNGGVLEFHNTETGEKLWCDLAKKTFVRSYKNRKSTKQVNYPAQFFKNLSGRVLMGQFKKKSTDSSAEKLIELIAYNYSTCTNFGTFLVKMFDHIHLEEYISAGVEFDFDIPYAYTDFPKDIRKKINDNGIRYTTSVGSLFCSEPDTGKAIFAQIKDCVSFSSMVNIISREIQALNTLVNYYNYDIKTLFAYFRERNWSTHNKLRRYMYYGDNSKDVPAPNLENSTTEELQKASCHSSTFVYDIVHFFRDYVVMAQEVYGDNGYDRYPKDLKQAHDDAQIIHATRKISETTQKSFAETIDTSLEWKSKDFQVIYPKSAGEVVAEGKILRHCVGSYINNVIQGRCKILFLRTTENPEKPLVTIEVAQNCIRQARGVGNSSPKYDASVALREYAKEKKLAYVG